MSYRTLGHSGLQVSTLTLGTMMFGEQTSTEDSLRIIDKACDQGINFIDTADVYTNGRSEEIVGCLLYTSPSPRDQRGSRMPSSA